MRTFLSLIFLATFMALPLLTLRAAETGTFTVGLSVTAPTGGSTTGTTGTGTTGGTTGGNGAPPEHQLPKILNVIVTPDIHSSLITYTTDPHALGSIQYGKTIDYEAGTISESFYVTSHATQISGLEADTLYYFKISVIDGFGGIATYIGTFHTTEVATTPTPVTPANPTTFTATPHAKEIDLNWITPGVVNPEVRIMKSDSFYPNDPSDGTLLFEGYGNSFPDTDVVPGKTYYYTLFVKQGDEYSSGVIAKATVPNVGVEPLPPSSNPFEGLPTSSNIDPKIQSLTLEDFLFIQDGKILSSHNGQINIDGEKNLTVILPYDRVPEILKTIGITLHDPEDPAKTFTFLLRVNEDKSGYVATIAPLGRSGIYNLAIIILDYKNQGLKELKGALLAEVQTALPIVGGLLGRISNLLDCPPFFLAIFLSVILAGALPRRRKDHGVIAASA